MCVCVLHAHFGQLDTIKIYIFPLQVFPQQLQVSFCNVCVVDYVLSIYVLGTFGRERWVLDVYSIQLGMYYPPCSVFVASDTVGN